MFLVLMKKDRKVQVMNNGKEEKVICILEERFSDLEAANNAYGQRTFHQIEPAFDKAQRQIQAQIESWYSRYAKNNGITMAEARKQLSAAELKELQWDVQEYIKYGQQNAMNQQWMKELENASARFHNQQTGSLETSDTAIHWKLLLAMNLIPWMVWSSTFIRQDIITHVLKCRRVSILVGKSVRLMKGSCKRLFQNLGQQMERPFQTGCGNQRPQWSMNCISNLPGQSF